MRYLFVLLLGLSPFFAQSQNDCSIEAVTATVVDCILGEFYLQLDFEHNNTPSDSFTLAGNGVFYGTFAYADLPITLGPLQANGTTDYEFVVHESLIFNCSDFTELGPVSCTGNCEIYDLEVETECLANGGYEAWINFEVSNPTQNHFDLWLNSQFYGFFALDSLPIHIPDFPTNPGPNDLVKVCINDNPNCCSVLEFPVPLCDTIDCSIYYLAVQATPCICGQFFAVLTFEYDHVGGGGFDVMGNGLSYGNFSYTHPQPIIIGPLTGDGSTAFEFVVKDHFHPICHDAVGLGHILCGPMNTDDASGHFSISSNPNPVSETLLVSLDTKYSVPLGKSSIQIFSVEGKEVLFEEKTQAVSNFSLDVRSLSAGHYRLVVRSKNAVWQGGFVKI